MGPSIVTGLGTDRLPARVTFIGLAKILLAVGGENKALVLIMESTGR